MPCQWISDRARAKGVAEGERSSRRRRARPQGSSTSGARYVDVLIHFISASGLPQMDVGGYSDPYLKASVDDKVFYTSALQPGNLNPVWNEMWSLKRIPANATLKVDAFDYDAGTPDEHIGSFSIPIKTGAQKAEFISTVRKLSRGVLSLDIYVSTSANPLGRPYTFDGPIRYFRHTSLTFGQLTQINDERLYSTWKMFLRAVPTFFPAEGQHWNRKYKAAQTIFQGPASGAVRLGIQAAHHLLYARGTSNQFGVINAPEDLMSVFHGGVRSTKNRIKPAVYTYVLSQTDDSLRFSETGAAFFVDFASKHALHSNCAEYVRYSGEFHLRPAGGWDKFKDSTPDKDVRWEFVIDNNSGTYSPDKKLLPKLKALLEYNFREFSLKVVVADFKDPELERSKEACRQYAVKYRRVKHSELQPTKLQGEVTLMQRAQKCGGIFDEKKKRPGARRTTGTVRRENRNPKRP